MQSAKRYDTWVVVCDTPGVEATLDEVFDMPGLHVVRVVSSKLEKLLNRSRLTSQLGYHLWQRRVLPIVTELHRQHQFDLVHQLTFNMFREPGYLWRLDVPFVWGPIGGTQNFPWKFLRKAGMTGALGELIRNCLNTFQLHTSQRFRKAGRQSAALIAANSTAQRDIKRHLERESVLMSDTGCSEICYRPRDHANEPLRIMWSGVVTTRKALYLLIEALAQLPSDVKYEVHVVGEGSDRIRCEKLARRLGVDQHIQWLGWLSHKDAMQHFMWANVFAFTSLRDTTGTVLSEALSHGVPIVCFDHQGSRDVVTSDCGIKIPVTSPEESVSNLAHAITRLARDHAAWKAMSDAARERAKRYLWDSLGEQMDKVYSAVWAEHSKTGLVDQKLECQRH
jgi:glycosyltransferase involved in cell wall biosynthesis